MQNGNMQVKFEFGFGRIIFGRVMPFGPRQFLFMVSAHYLSHALKFRMYAHHKNTQVKFEFCFGRINFGRVMPLGLRQFLLIHGFRSISIDILN